MIALAVSNIFQLIFLLLFIYILLTWFPNIKWHKQPFFSLKVFSDIFFAPFRKIIPPVAMLDLSPIAAFICLSILSKIIIGALASLGL